MISGYLKYANVGNTKNGRFLSVTVASGKKDANGRAVYYKVSVGDSQKFPFVSNFISQVGTENHEGKQNLAGAFNSDIYLTLVPDNSVPNGSYVTEGNYPSITYDMGWGRILVDITNLGSVFGTLTEESKANAKSRRQNNAGQTSTSYQPQANTQPQVNAQASTANSAPAVTNGFDLESEEPPF